MLDEPRLLLLDFLTDMSNYVGIMRAMAYGAHTLKEIGERNGLSSTHMSSYLGILRETDFVERIVPITQQEQKSRLGQYVITDPYLRFYFRFLAAYQSKLAMGQQQAVLHSIEEHLPAFIEANTWREMCQEWLLRASDRQELPVTVATVGESGNENLRLMSLELMKKIAALFSAAHYGRKNRSAFGQFKSCYNSLNLFCLVMNHGASII